MATKTHNNCLCFSVLVAKMLYHKLFVYSNYHSYFRVVKPLLIPNRFDTFTIDLHIYPI